MKELWILIYNSRSGNIALYEILSEFFQGFSIFVLICIACAYSRCRIGSPFGFQRLAGMISLPDTRKYQAIRGPTELLTYS